MFLVLFFLFGLIQPFLSLSKIVLYGTLFDFGYFLRAANNLTLGINPYFAENFVYPLPVLFLYFPFLYFSLVNSQIIWFLLSLLVLLAAVFFTFKSLSWKPKTKEWLLFLPLIFLSFPVKWTFGLGQINFFVLLSLVLVFYFSRKNNDLMAGIFLGLAVILKLTPVFFIFYFYIKKRPKIIITSLITAGFLLIFSGFVFGFDLIVDFFTIVIPRLFEPSSKNIYYNQSFSSFSAYIFKGKNYLGVINVIFAFVIIFFSFLIFKRNKEIKGMDFSLAVCTILLINGFSWQHHFVWLIFPFLAYKKENKNLTVLIICYLLTSFNFKNPGLLGEGFFAKILQVHVFFGTLLLWVSIVFKSLAGKNEKVLS